MIGPIRMSVPPTWVCPFCIQWAAAREGEPPVHLHFVVAEGFVRTTHCSDGSKLIVNGYGMKLEGVMF